MNYSESVSGTSKRLSPPRGFGVDRRSCGSRSVGMGAFPGTQAKKHGTAPRAAVHGFQTFRKMVEREGGAHAEPEPRCPDQVADGSKRECADAECPVVVV